MNAKTLAPNYKLGHRLKVLVVDSNNESLRYMKLVLEEQLHQVIDVPSTITALAKVYDLRNQFNVAIVDMQMPEIHILQDLKKALVNMFVPMILISDDNNMAQKAIEEGAIAFFKKPMEYHNLINIWEFASRKFLMNGNQLIISESQPNQSTELLGFANKNKCVNLVDQIPVAYPTNPVNNQQRYHYLDINGKRPETSHVNEQLPLFGEFDNTKDQRKLSYEERAKIRIERMKALGKPYSSNTNMMSQQKHIHYNSNYPSPPQGINQPQTQVMVGSLNPTYGRGPSQLQAGETNESGAFRLDRAGNVIRFEDKNKTGGTLGKPPIAPRWIAPPPPMAFGSVEQPQVGGGETKNYMFSQDFQNLPGLQAGQISSSTSNMIGRSDIMHIRGDGVFDTNGGHSKEEDWVMQWLMSIPKTDDDFGKFLDDLQF